MYTAGADPNIFVSSADAALTLTGVISTGAAGGVNGTTNVQIQSPNQRWRNCHVYQPQQFVQRCDHCHEWHPDWSGEQSVSGLRYGSLRGGDAFGLQLGRDNVTLATDNVAVLAGNGAVIYRGIIVNKIATSDTTTPRTGSAFIGGAPDGLTPATFGNLSISDARRLSAPTA